MDGIIIDDKRLNPSSPEFDLELWKNTLMEFMSKADIDSFIDRMDYAAECLIDGNLTPEGKMKLSNTVRFFVDGIRESLSKQNNPRTIAINNGAIVTIHNRLASPSREFLRAFTGHNIRLLPGKNGITYRWDEYGQLCFLDGADFNDVVKIHGAFLMSILALAMETSYNDENHNDTVKFYAKQIIREMGIDTRSYSNKREKDEEKKEDAIFRIIYSLVEPFENFAGNIDGIYYRVLALQSYDSNTTTTEISSPYIFRLLEKMNDSKNREYHRLIYSKVVNERDYAAVELANTIISGVLRRGTFTKKEEHIKKRTTKITDEKTGKSITNTVEYEVDSKDQGKNISYTYSVKYISLIEECPQLNSALSTIANSDCKNKAQRYNVKLKRIFEAAFRIILEDSDLPNTYSNFRINGISEWESYDTRESTKKGTRRRAANFHIPTKTRLNDLLVITHDGTIKSKI